MTSNTKSLESEVENEESTPYYNEAQSDTRKNFLQEIINRVKTSINNSLNSELGIDIEAYNDILRCLKKNNKLQPENQDGPLLEFHIEEIVVPLSEHLLNRILKFHQENLEKGEKQYELAVSEAAKLFSFSYKLVYIMASVFGCKRVINFFSFESKNLEPVTLFAYYLPSNREYWEVVYVLAMWLSRLSLVPFAIESMDNQIFGKPLVDRLLDLAKKYAFSHGNESGPGSMLLTTLISRADLSKTTFDTVFSYVYDKACGDPSSSGCEVSRALRIFNKIFKISDKKLYLSKIPQFVKLSNLLDDDLEAHSTLTRAQLVKFNMHLAVILVRHGSGIFHNTATTDNVQDVFSDSADLQAVHINIIKTLLKRTIISLEDKSQEIRSKSASSIAVLLHLLGPQMKLTIIKFILNIFDVDNSSIIDEEFGPIRNFQIVSENLWNGACLALREIITLSSVPESLLGKVVDVLNEALSFHYRSGDSEIGMHVREAACSAIWCLLKHYPQSSLSKLYSEILSPLVSVSLLDKEVTVRRAAVTALTKLFQKSPSCTQNYNYIHSVINYHSITNKNNSMGPLTCQVCDNDHSMIKGILKTIFFQCIDSRDNAARMVTSATLAIITVNHKDYSISVLKRLLTIFSSKCGYAIHGATCTLYNIYKSLKTLDLDPELLYLTTISAFSATKRPDRKPVKLDILRSIAICRLIAVICSNPSFTVFLISHSSSKNINIHDLIWGFLLETFENIDLSLEKEVSICILAVSRSSLALNNKSLKGEIFGIVPSPEITKNKSLRKIVIYLLNTDNFSPSEVEYAVSILCYLATKKNSSHNYLFKHQIRNLVTRNLVNLFNVYILKNYISEIYIRCFKKLFDCVLCLLDDYTMSFEGDVGSKIRIDASKFLAHVSLHIRTTEAAVHSAESPQNDTLSIPDIYVNSDDMYKCVCKILRLSIEKINTVRQAVLTTINIILSNNFIKFEGKQVLVELIPDYQCFKMNPNDYFDKFAKLIKYKLWRKAVLDGFVTGYGSLSKSISDPCTTSLCKLSNELINSPSSSETSAEDLIHLLITTTLESKNCTRLYRPSLELLEYFAYNEMIAKYSTTIDIRLLVDYINTRLKISNDYNEICSLLKICTYMGAYLASYTLDDKKAPLLYEYLLLATSGLTHIFPRVREVAAEHIYTSLSISLLYRSTTPENESKTRLLDCLFSDIGSPITDEEAEKIKLEIINIMRPYISAKDIVKPEVIVKNFSNT